jgi:hypothetical protein
MLQNFKNLLHRAFPGRSIIPSRQTISSGSKQQSLKAIGINDFLNIDVPAREMLLSPILPERSLAMLYAPRGLGKSWLSLSITSMSVDVIVARALQCGCVTDWCFLSR